MSMITLRGHEFKFSFADVNQAKRYQEAFGPLVAEIDTALTSGFALEAMESLYAAMSGFFDAQLGEGSLDTILDGEHDILEAVDVFFDLRDEALASMAARSTAIAARAKLPDKYNPDKLKRK